jgi:hypothetical protein
MTHQDSEGPEPRLVAEGVHRVDGEDQEYDGQTERIHVRRDAE